MTNNLTIIPDECTNVHNFGVELELIGTDKAMLIAALALKGIECIDEGYTHTVTRQWKIVPDASVNGMQGCELVSPILNGVQGLKTLREVCKTLDFVNANVNRSCGVHIHHEAQGLTEQQKTNLMKFYARLERTIDAFMPSSRKRNNNTYCRSMIDAFEQMSYNTLDGLGRYYKLNFASLSRYGTLEFRQHSGTTEFDKLYHWIVFTANFLHLCKDKVSRSAMNYIERAWTKKHLKLSCRTWGFFKSRMKVLDDLDISTQTGPVVRRVA